MSDRKVAFRLLGGALWVLLGVAWTLPFPCHAQNPLPEGGVEEQAGWLAALNPAWGGHVKIRGRVAWAESDSLAAAGDAGPLYDGNLEFRLKNTLGGDRIRLDTHYELIMAGGDSLRRASDLALLVPGLLPARFLATPLIEDDRRLFDLTDVIHQDESTVVAQRLDRLVLTLASGWGTVRAGRQAVTWGNGLLFNPMDLFNPFAPTDIERDYKVGDDLLLVQKPAFGGNLQGLYVPRRDPATGEVRWNQSSLAGKLHLATGVTEFDILAAEHFDDEIFGLGAVGYLGGAAWRLDATWTHLDAESPENDYLSLVANLDYAWVWQEKNFYGFVEFFYNGLGEGKENYSAAFTNPEILARLDRGELFTVGRFYLSGQVQVELHPLVNVLLTVINNIADPSGLLQPRLIWNTTQNTQVLVGGTIVYGSRGSEFGGFVIPGTSFTTRAADSVYLRGSYYF